MRKKARWFASCFYRSDLMAVDSRRAHPAPVGGPSGAAQPLLRYALWATAAMIAVSGAVAALISAVSGFLVMRYARPRGQWGTLEPPDGVAEEVAFLSAEDN